MRYATVVTGAQDVHTACTLLLVLRIGIHDVCACCVRYGSCLHLRLFSDVRPQQQTEEEQTASRIVYIIPPCWSCRGTTRGSGKERRYESMRHSEKRQQRN